MKKTIVLILAILTIISTHCFSQNSSSTHKIYTDEQDIELQTKGNEVVFLKINGKTIAKNNYGLHQNLIDSILHNQPTPPQPEEPEVENKEPNENEILNSQIASYLINEGVLKNKNKYKVKLTYESVVLNGKLLSEEHHSKLIEIFERVMNRKFTNKTSLKIKIKNENKSTTLIEKGHFSVDKDIEF